MTISKKLNSILKEYAAGNKLSAYKKFKKIYLQNNKNIKMRYNLAVMQQEIGLLSEAELNYNFLIKNSGDIKSKINLYNIYFIRNFYEKALILIDEILREYSNFHNVMQDKAFALFKLKRFEDSIDICLELLQTNKNINILNTLGLNYFAIKKYDEAKRYLLDAFEIDGNNIPVLNSLGRLNQEIRESIVAKKYFEKAISLGPNIFETLNNFAGFYLEEAKYSKALNLYKLAEEINPQNNIIINNISKVYFSLGNIDMAEKYCKKSLKMDPNNGDFQKGYSLILLKKYEFEKAWKYFDGRLGLSDFISKNSNLNIVKKKILTKNRIEKNSKILVIREQGVGDEILYASMYKDLLHKYKNVIIECDERLITLFKNSYDLEHEKKFVKLGKFSYKKHGIDEFDYVIYAGSLGKFFRNNIESFSKKPYLKPIKNYKDNELDSLLNNKKLKIGLSWKSFKNRYAREKSIQLSDFTEILKKTNCIFFNLQYGDIENELVEFNKINNNKILSLKKLDLFNNFVGLSNLLINLDVFITVSNSTAHLAGSLGVNTYIIKPENHASYHYWNYENGITPWYNNIKIISKEELQKLSF